jgi:hypothetical protein
MGGQRHVPAALTPINRPGTHCTGGWVGPRAGLDGCGKFRLHQDSIPGPSRPYRVAIPARCLRVEQIATGGSRATRMGNPEEACLPEL